MNRDSIVVVSGLPRSGTSLMMSMLEAGGLGVLTDGLRVPDEDNPKGYYEFELVKQIEHEQDWLDDARGKAVKMIAELLKHLPPEYSYKVVFMRRNLDEVLASQHQMLIRRGEPTDKVKVEDMARMYRNHLSRVEAWMTEQPNVDVVYVSYNDLLADPAEQARRVNQFLGGTLETEKMIKTIDASLYRQRR